MFFIKKLKSCFAQGENNKRSEVLKSIMEAIHAEYTENNYYSRLYWIVEELLLNDPEFRDHLDEHSIECIKNGLIAQVDNAAKQRIKV